MNKNNEVSLAEGTSGIFTLPLILAALGYFVETYDFAIFPVVKDASIGDILGNAYNAHAVAVATYIINAQAMGMLLGGIIIGMLGDKLGRVKVLLFTITTYSMSTFLTGLVTNHYSYAIFRFISGVGMGGEFGLSVALITEIIDKRKREYATAILVFVGMLGAISSTIIFKILNNWHYCYFLGGTLGLLLLFLRTNVKESSIFLKIKNNNKISRGSIRLLFSSWNRSVKFLAIIFLNAFAWFATGVLMVFAKEFIRNNNQTPYYDASLFDSSWAVMVTYLGVSLGAIAVTTLSKLLKNRKKIMLICTLIQLITSLIFLSPLDNSPTITYICCFFMGIGASVITLSSIAGAEQFGANLRSTVCTMIPNLSKLSIVLTNIVFVSVFINKWNLSYRTTGVIFILFFSILSLILFRKIEETYNKSMDYIEV